MHSRRFPQVMTLRIIHGGLSELKKKKKERETKKWKIKNEKKTSAAAKTKRPTRTHAHAQHSHVQPVTVTAGWCWQRACLMLVVVFFPPIIKHHRIVMTTGGQNNVSFYYNVCSLHCDPTEKTQQLQSKNRREEGKKIMMMIRATVSSIISCVVKEPRRRAASRQKQTIQSESDFQKKKKKWKNKKRSIRNPDLVLPNTQLVSKELTTRFSAKTTTKNKKKKTKTNNRITSWQLDVIRRSSAAAACSQKLRIEIGARPNWNVGRCHNKVPGLKKTKQDLHRLSVRKKLVWLREKKTHLCYSTWKTARRAVAWYRRTGGGARASEVGQGGGRGQVFTSVVPFSRWL